MFLGLKFSTPVFFWVEDLTVYFFGSEKSAHIFLCIFFGSKMSSLVFFWVHNIRSMYFFVCTPPPPPPSRLYPSNPPGGSRE